MHIRQAPYQLSYIPRLDRTQKMGANGVYCLVSLALLSAVLVLILGTVATGAQKANGTV